MILNIFHNSKAISRWRVKTQFSTILIQITKCFLPNYRTTCRHQKIWDGSRHGQTCSISELDIRLQRVQRSKWGHFCHQWRRSRRGGTARRIEGPRDFADFSPEACPWSKENRFAILVEKIRLFTNLLLDLRQRIQRVLYRFSSRFLSLRGGCCSRWDLCRFRLQ